MKRQRHGNDIEHQDAARCRHRNETMPSFPGASRGEHDVGGRIDGAEGLHGASEGGAYLQELAARIDDDSDAGVEPEPSRSIQ
jgi:hypothetical protein